MGIQFSDKSLNTTCQTLKKVETKIVDGKWEPLSNSTLKQFAVVTGKDNSSALKSYNVVQRFFIHFAQLFGFCKHITLCDTIAVENFLTAFNEQTKNYKTEYSEEDKPTVQKSRKAACDILTSIGLIHYEGVKKFFDDLDPAYW